MDEIFPQFVQVFRGVDSVATNEFRTTHISTTYCVVDAMFPGVDALGCQRVDNVLKAENTHNSIHPCGYKKRKQPPEP